MDLHQQNKIDIKLSELDIVGQIPHDQFIPTQDGGLAVKTSQGSMTLTQKDVRLFKERPGIPKNEYSTLFGIDRVEYKRRVEARNAFVRNEIESKTTDVVKESIEFTNPAFEDPYLPSPINASEEWRSQTFKTRLSSAMVGAVSSVKETVGDLLSHLKPSQRVEDDNIQMVNLTAEDRDSTTSELEQMHGRLQDLGPESGALLDEINAMDIKISKSPENVDSVKRTRSQKVDQLHVKTKLEEFDKIRERKNIIIKLVVTWVGTAAAGGILTGIFEAIAKALGSDTAKDFLPKSSDPKDIADSGIGKAITEKLSGLAGYFREKYLNSVGTPKAFWHMLEKAVEYMKDNLWLIVAGALAITAYELNKKK